MSHIPAEQWLLYVGGKLTPEERVRCEAHLSGCDDCLETYMQCMAQLEEQLPMLSDEAAFSEAVMKRFDEQLALSHFTSNTGGARPMARKQHMQLYKHPFFHYAVAAVITLILMSSGVFNTLTQQMASMEPVPFKTEPPDEHTSFSKKLLDQTIVMLDSIQPKRERGSNR